MIRPTLRGASSLPALLRAGLLALCGVLWIGLAAGARAAEEEGGSPHYPTIKPEKLDWSFAGPFGKYDPAQLRRGLQVYRRACAGCHGLAMVPFRTLAAPGGPQLSEAEMREVAAAYTVADGPNEQGAMFTRPGRPPDRFPSPYPNPEAAAAALGAPPPDLSLMAKARGVGHGFPVFIWEGITQYQEGGPDYIHALLTGYRDPPEGEEAPAAGYYNPYFVAGNATAMPPPLFDGDIPYPEGVEGTVDQYARDVAAFLMWTAEPHLVERKRIGFTVIIFLAIFVALMFASKRLLWKDIAH